MFVFSFKASSIKIFCILCVCIIAGSLIIAFMPDAGYALNVNKNQLVKELEKISVKNNSGRIEYLNALGFSVNEKPKNSATVTVPEIFDAPTEKYNELQKSQGFTLEKYKGKKVKSYTYTVTSLPDETNFGDNEMLATIIVYNNKVIAADLSCEKLGLVSGVIQTV